MDKHVRFEERFLETEVLIHEPQRHFKLENDLSERPGRFGHMHNNNNNNNNDDDDDDND